MPGERVDLIEQEAINQVVKATAKVDLLTKSVLKLMDASNGKKIDFIDIDSPKKLETVLTNITSRQKELKGATEQVQTAYKEQERTEKALIVAIERRSIAVEGTNRALIKQRGALNRTNAELRKQDTVATALDSTYQKLLHKYTELNKKAREAGARFGAQSKEFKKASKAALDYRNKLDKIDNTLKNSQRNVGRYNTALKSTGKLFRQVIGALGVASAITTIFAVIRGGLNTIVEFDRQLIAVGKTTNITGKELKDFGDQAITLGIQLKGISTNNLLKSAEIAGQLGIRGTANILKFSETIEKLALTSDIAGQESARAFAKFIEVSSDSVENADRLGSVITELGNNFATTESEILKNTTEIQKGIAIYETSAQSVIALGAATNALGGQAEASRGAMQKTFKVLNEGATSGKNLEKILKLTGQTAGEFKEEFGRDAVSVFNKFVKGLSESAKAGENLSVTLGELGLGEKRTEAVIGSLAKNYDVLEDALSRANTEYETNIALNAEYNAAAESLSSHIGDLSDAWANLILNVEKGDGAISIFFKNSVRDFTELVALINTWNATNETAFKGAEIDAYSKKIENAKKDFEVFLTVAQGDTSEITFVDVLNADLEKLNDTANQTLYWTKLLEEVELDLSKSGVASEERALLEARKQNAILKLGELHAKKGEIRALKELIGLEEKLAKGTDGGEGSSGKDPKEIKDKYIEINHILEESIAWYERLLSLNNKLIKNSNNQDERNKLREENELIQDRIDMMNGKGSSIAESAPESDEAFDFNTFDRAFTALTQKAFGSMKFDMDGLMEEYKKLYGEDFTEFEKWIQKKLEAQEGLSGGTIDIIRAAQDLLYQGTDLGYALIDRRIQKIEEERDVITERYDAELTKLDELAEKENLSEVERLAIEKRKKILEKEKEKAEKKKNEEIAKEKIKQAKLDKANAIVQTIINTIVGVMGASPAIPLMALIAATGAASVATIIAQPIPKYRKGKKSTDRYEGLAMVNDATISGRVIQEFREDKHGNISAYSGKNVLTHVAKDDIIYKDLDSLMESHTPEEIMKKAYNASVITSLDINNNRLDQYQAQNSFNRNLRESQFEEKMIRTMKNWKFHHHTDNNQLAETIADLKDANDFRDGLM